MRIIEWDTLRNWGDGFRTWGWAMKARWGQRASGATASQRVEEAWSHDVRTGNSGSMNWGRQVERKGVTAWRLGI